MKNLTPAQLLHAKMVGNLGGSIGLLLAFLTFIYRLVKNFDVLVLGFAIFVFFMMYMQIIQYIQTKKQYDNLVSAMQQMGG